MIFIVLRFAIGLIVLSIEVLWASCARHCLAWIFHFKSDWRVTPNALSVDADTTGWLDDSIVTESPAVGEIVIIEVLGTFSFSLFDIMYSSARSTVFCARRVVWAREGVDGIRYWSSTKVVIGGSLQSSSWMAV